MHPAVKYAAGGGIVAGIIGVGIGTWRLLTGAEGEPAAPVPLPQGDVTPTIPSASPSADAKEIEALARTIASEAGSGTLAEQKAIGWTVRNRFRGKSIYATQYPWRAQKGGDPPFSSARPANDAHLRLAREILAADQSQDPTGGATSFFEPKMQDLFAKAGEMARNGETGDRVIDGVKLTDITRFKFYRKNADQIREKWYKSNTIYAIAGRFEFWGSQQSFAKRGGKVLTVVGCGYDILGAEA